MTVYEGCAETLPYLVQNLEREGQSPRVWGHLCAVDAPVASHWHSNWWPRVEVFPFVSIGQTAKRLRELGALWIARPQSSFRRHHLVQEALPHFRPRPREFPFVPPPGRIGVWTLGPDGNVWACAQPENPFPAGDPHLAENKVDPPSSAYRKLQEALCLWGDWPRPGQVCWDVGSAPGGWTWVAAERGAEVTSFDRAPLDARLMNLPQVHFVQGNAFAWGPDKVDHLDWLLSDVICYPQKLWDWLKPWISSGRVDRIIATVKLQGSEVPWDVLDQMASVPSSRLVHLHHNKHELTWMANFTSRWAAVPNSPEPD